MSGVGRGVMQHAQHRHQIGDLRRVKQAAQPDDLDRHSRALQGLPHQAELATPPAQHRGFVPARRSRVPAQLLGMGVRRL